MTARAGMSRRQLLKGAGMGAGAAALLGADAAGADVPDGILTGVVTSAGASSLGVRRASGATVRVEPAAGAVLFRDRAVDLGAFEAGDEVTAEGGWRGDTFVAERITSTFRVVSGTVTSRSGSRLATTDGVIRLAGTTEADDGEGLQARRLSSLGVGDAVVARGRLDRATGELVAFRVGVAL